MDSQIFATKISSRFVDFHWSSHQGKFQQPFRSHRLSSRFKFHSSSIIPCRISQEIHEWWFPKIGVPKNGWSIMQKPIKVDDLKGTPISGNPRFRKDSFFLVKAPKEQWQISSPLQHCEVHVDCSSITKSYQATCFRTGPVSILFNICRVGGWLIWTAL